MYHRILDHACHKVEQTRSARFSNPLNHMSVRCTRAVTILVYLTCCSRVILLCGNVMVWLPPHALAVAYISATLPSSPPCLTNRNGITTSSFQLKQLIGAITDIAIRNVCAGLCTIWNVDNVWCFTVFEVTSCIPFYTSTSLTFIVFSAHSISCWIG